LLVAPVKRVPYYSTLVEILKLIMMKKTILFISMFIICCSIDLNAQDGDNSRGIRAGWQSSDFYNDGVSVGGDPLSSFYVGFFNERKIIPLLSFGSGLEYFQNGSDLGSDIKYKQHILSIPLYLKLKIGPVYATGGASANFRVAEKYIVGDSKIDVPEAWQSNWFDVPMHAGLGVELLIFRIEARYHWGMMDSFKNTTGNSQYFQLGAGVSF